MPLAMPPVEPSAGLLTPRVQQSLVCTPLYTVRPFQTGGGGWRPRNPNHLLHLHEGALRPEMAGRCRSIRHISWALWNRRQRVNSGPAHAPGVCVWCRLRCDGPPGNLLHGRPPQKRAPWMATGVLPSQSRMALLRWAKLWCEAAGRLCAAICATSESRGGSRTAFSFSGHPHASAEPSKMSR